MPNFRAGIDDNCGDFSLIARLNAPFDDRKTMIASLQALAAVQAEKLDPKRTLGFKTGSDGEKLPRTVVGDLKLSLLTAFGLRFFLGPLEARGQEEAVQNFPPGGVFKARIPSRFGIVDDETPQSRRLSTPLSTPLYLRTMAADGDRDYVSQRLAAQSPGAPPTDAQVTQAYQSWLSQGESDLILQLDAKNQFAVVDLWDALRDRFVKPFGYQIVSLERGFTRGDGRAHIGFIDGTSNLQHLMTDNPEAYRRLIYLPTPAPAYPGYPVDLRGLTQNCDDMRVDGGTYMVYRKYAFNLKLWFAEDFEVSDFWGDSFRGDEGRLHAIGRDRDSGLVIDRASRCPLHPEPDHTEINRGFNESHALKARGGRTAPFSGPFPPVPEGFGNVFDTQDIRIRRRSIPYGDLDPTTGEIEWGLHFICYQNNIQQAGFEFINNIWLFNPDFRRSVDGLFNPARSAATPVLGAYYFVPPPQHAYPGDCFFE